MPKHRTSQGIWNTRESSFGHLLDCDGNHRQDAFASNTEEFNRSAARRVMRYRASLPDGCDRCDFFFAGRSDVFVSFSCFLWLFNVILARGTC